MRRPPAFLRLLDEQLRRRERGQVPAVDEDPAWIIRETGIDPAFQLRSHFLEQVVDRSRRLSGEPRHGVADLAGIGHRCRIGGKSRETDQRVHEPLVEPEARRRVPHRIVGCVHIGNLAAERPAELGRRCPVGKCLGPGHIVARAGVTRSVRGAAPGRARASVGRARGPAGRPAVAACLADSFAAGSAPGPGCR